MKIIIWGTSKRAAMYYPWLKRIYKVIGFLETTNTQSDEIYGIPIVPIEEIKKIKFDKIILAVEPYEEKKILYTAQKHSIVTSVISIDRLIKKNDYIEYITGIQIDIIKEILNATETEISSEEWLYDRIVRYGIHCFQKNWYLLDKNIEWNVYGLQQLPKEFAKWCVALSELSDIHKAIEIGVYRGRSAYFMCAILMRRNPEIQYYMVDITDRLDHFELFCQLLPGLQKAIPATSKDYAGEQFDFAFIDADHSYEASIADFQNVGRYATHVVGFHDIYGHEYDHENGGTVRTWKEVCELSKGKEYSVFSEYPDRWMGIGCVWK